MKLQPLPTQTESRVIRVFVSSTFCDMKAERDYLVKFTFPQLRKLCEQRSVVWGEVDLRWGIPDEEKAEGKVLPICLAEIQRCRPYFIGLLGERYGTVPETIPTDLIDREPWLKEHQDHSITELEILHGVLNDSAMADHAFFYFRDPAYVENMPMELRTDFLPESVEAVSKLRALKDRIRRSGLPVRENYHDHKQLGQWVLEDFTRLIDELFPENQIPNPLDREAMEHEAFARSRAVVEVRSGLTSGVYIGRSAYFERLDHHAVAEGPPLVILGQSGSGKSALLANWALRYRNQHPDAFLILHFIGASPYSADWAAMVRRILDEFNRRFEFKIEIPNKSDALRLTFANALHMAGAKSKIIIVLDALNQLEDSDAAPDLVWLPPVIPANIRLIVSTLPGRPLDDLTKRGWPTLSVEPLTIPEREQLIHDYLAQYTKTLSTSLLKRIAQATQTAIPLYLRALLEELRVFGVYEQLEARIADYLTAKTLSDLYEKILKRYEADYETDRPGLVKDAMCLIWAARRGLSETELLELLGAPGEPLPRAYWSPLYLAAEHALVSRSGLIGFFHDYLRQAVLRKYLPDQVEQHTTHLRLADYFESQPQSSRQIDELPWQLSESEAWQRLADGLVDLDFFYAAWQANQFAVKAYWVRIEAHSPIRLIKAYHDVLARPEGYLAEQVSYLSALLVDMGHVEEALCLRTYLVDHCRQVGDQRNLAVCLGNKALILIDRGDIDGAMALLKEQEQLYLELDDPAGLTDSQGKQALIFIFRGDLDGAMALLKEQERLCQELGDLAGLARSRGNQALILKDWGNFDSALALHKEEERLWRELGNPEGLASSLNNEALILKSRGDLDGAMVLLGEKERLCREFGDLKGLQSTFGNQALILKSRGDLDGAMALHKEEEQLCRTLTYSADLSDSLGNQALILKSRGDLDGAMALLKEQERLCRALGHSAGLASCLGNIGLVQKELGQPSEALERFHEVEYLFREIGQREGLARALCNQGLILQALSRWEESYEKLQAAEQISHELDDKALLAHILDYQARRLENMGRLEDAIARYQDAEALFRLINDPQGLTIALCDQANLLTVGMNQPLKGLALVGEIEDLISKHSFSLLGWQMQSILESIKTKAEESRSLPD